VRHLPVGDGAGFSVKVIFAIDQIVMIDRWFLCATRLLGASDRKYHYYF